MLSVLLCLAAAFQPLAPLLHHTIIVCFVTFYSSDSTAQPVTIIHHSTQTRPCSTDTNVDLCKSLARWGRGAAQKKTMPSFDPSPGPSSSQPTAGSESVAKPQTASSLTTNSEQIDSPRVLHVASSPIADLERKKVFVRASYRDIFARIWKLMRLWILYKKAELATSKGKKKTLTLDFF